MLARQVREITNNTNENAILDNFHKRIEDAANAGLVTVRVELPNTNKNLAQAVLRVLRTEGYFMRIHNEDYPECDVIEMDIRWDVTEPPVYRSSYKG
jgi:hypothetical protein